MQFGIDQGTSEIKLLLSNARQIATTAGEEISNLVIRSSCAEPDASEWQGAVSSATTTRHGIEPHSSHIAFRVDPRSRQVLGAVPEMLQRTPSICH